MLNTLLQALELKDEKRTGWQLRNIKDPESVAAHSWGVSLLCMLYAEEEDVEPEHALKLATVHDLPEAKTGDTATRARKADQELTDTQKKKLEYKAGKFFADKLETPEIQKCFEEYQRKETKAAWFVSDMDKIDMCLQALKYEKQGRYDKETSNEELEEYEDLDEFFATAEPRLKTETGRQLFEEIKQEYEEAKG